MDVASQPDMHPSTQLRRDLPPLRTGPVSDALRPTSGRDAKSGRARGPIPRDWRVTAVRSLKPAAALVLALGTTACAAGAPEPRGPARPVPAYDTDAAALFDDAIEPTAVGLGSGLRKPPHVDNALRERTQVGDGVLRVRVVTITSKQEDSGRSWQLGVRTMEALAGARPPSGDFTLAVGPAAA